MGLFGLQQDPNPGTDVIPSTSLSLTRGTNAVAALVGVGTVGSEVVAGIANAMGADLTGFTTGQLMVVLVAVIAVVGFVNAADVLARALATSRPTALVPTPLPIPAQLRDNGDGTDGDIIALRSDGQVLFRKKLSGEIVWVANRDLRSGSWLQDRNGTTTVIGSTS